MICWLYKACNAWQKEVCSGRVLNQSLFSPVDRINKCRCAQLTVRPTLKDTCALAQVETMLHNTCKRAFHRSHIITRACPHGYCDITGVKESSVAFLNSPAKVQLKQQAWGFLRETNYSSDMEKSESVKFQISVLTWKLIWLRLKTQTNRKHCLICDKCKISRKAVLTRIAHYLLISH